MRRSGVPRGTLSSTRIRRYLPAGGVFRRVITQHVLVVQGDADVGHGVAQAFPVGHAERQPAGPGGKVLHELRPTGLLFRLRVRLEEAHGEDLGIGLHGEGHQLAQGVAAGIIGAIGDHHQRPARVAGPLQPAEAQVDAIDQRGASAGAAEEHGVAELRGIVAGAQFGAVRHGDQEDLVFRVELPEHLRHGLARGAQLLAHAAAGVQHDAHGNGSILAGKRNDAAGLLLIEHAEIFRTESQDVAAQRIDHGYGDQRHLHVHAYGALRSQVRLLLPQGQRSAFAGRCGQRQRQSAKRPADQSLCDVFHIRCHDFHPCPKTGSGAATNTGSKGRSRANHDGAGSASTHDFGTRKNGRCPLSAALGTG